MKRFRTWRRPIVLIASIAVLVAALIAWLIPEPQSAALVRPVPLPMADSARQTSLLSSAAASIPMRQSSAAQSNADVRHRLDELDALVRSGQAEELFGAAKMVNQCVTMELLHQRNPSVEAPEEFCKQMNPQYLRDRLQWIEVALAARIKGAAREYAQMGPNGNMGDLYSRPEDPLVVAWTGRLRQVTEAYAMDGDLEALGYMAVLYSDPSMGEPDLVKSLAYHKAMLLLLDKAWSRASIPDTDARIASLGPDRAAQANQLFQTIVSTVRIAKMRGTRGSQG